eukprot:TRINITY_DN10686_c0_g1_i1.p1 TRINITY_DN10686_c0_g1~~TRINITY_DN10686_c0_g1_i1.p1  ORF type:complete len:333 (+),score=33.35 TRINITY_DN10686_c0_g1_i1:63-1061(+)
MGAGSQCSQCDEGSESWTCGSTIPVILTFVGTAVLAWLFIDYHLELVPGAAHSRTTQLLQPFFAAPANPPRSPPPRQRRPKLAPYITEHYWKEYSDTDGHLATTFTNKTHPLEQEERVRVIRGLLPHLARYLDHIAVPYWLDWGTLLGSWRTGDVIPWDDDGDVGFLERDIQAIRRGVRDGYRFKCKCILIDRHPPAGVDIPFIFVDYRSGVYVDLFVYRPVTRKGKRFLTNKVWPTYSPNVVPAAYVFPLAKCQLGGSNYTCPQRTKAYLTSMYGDLSVPFEHREEAGLPLEDEIDFGAEETELPRSLPQQLPKRRAPRTTQESRRPSVRD